MDMQGREKFLADLMEFKSSALELKSKCERLAISLDGPVRIPAGDDEDEGDDDDEFFEQDHTIVASTSARREEQRPIEQPVSQTSIASVSPMKASASASRRLLDRRYSSDNIALFADQKKQGISCQSRFN